MTTLIFVWIGGVRKPYLIQLLDAFYQEIHDENESEDNEQTQICKMLRYSGIIIGLHTDGLTAI